MNLAIALFAVSQRPTSHDGAVTRIWQRELFTEAGGPPLGPSRTFYVDVRHFAAKHPEIVTTDPGYIGSNLSIYLRKDPEVWAEVLGVTVDDLYEAAKDAGLDVTKPLFSAKPLPAGSAVAA